jgi:hypothetical protein
MKAPLPGLDILKLAYLNSKFGTKIALVFPPSAMSNLHKYHQTAKFIEMLQTHPDQNCINLEFPLLLKSFYEIEGYII